MVRGLSQSSISSLRAGPLGCLRGWWPTPSQKSFTDAQSSVSA